MRYSTFCLLVLLTAGLTVSAQHVPEASQRPLASNVVVPQSRSFRANAAATVVITRVEARVHILEQVATTVIDVHLSNPGGVQQEAELILPVPDGAVVRGFDFEGAASEPTAELLDREQARLLYDSIVAKLRDPALLEFVGYNLIRSSVFPVEAGGTQRIRLTYETLLTRDGGRVDYVLPRSESVEYMIPWQVHVQVKAAQAISTVYSPSHSGATTRLGPQSFEIQLGEQIFAEQPGPFLLSYLLEEEGVSASLLAFPDPKIGGGYFLLLAGLPAAPEEMGQGMRRDVTLVLDRSGSMNGEKIEQVREAALQILAGLEEGESFNIIVYNDAVDSFAEHSVLKSPETVEAAREYLKTVKARGGTNIYGALTEALRSEPQAESLPMLLFLTDGLPTVGSTSEVEIRDLALHANPYERRIYTFGVGVDVNTPLLEKIATESRAAATFVLPHEDVEVKVASVFRRLCGPVLAEPELRVAPQASGVLRVRELLPQRLPDLFDGDQLVMIGKYLGDEPLDFTLKGNFLGNQRVFQFTFDLARATTRNAFVPRLWASRKIALLIDAVRQLGAVRTQYGTQGKEAGLEELVTEIVKLSKEFGILTEYTAFLAREGVTLDTFEGWAATCEDNLRDRAMNTRSGLSSVNQDLNNGQQRRQVVLNGGNFFYDENMNRAAITSVQQVCDLAFFRRGDNWVDSRLLGNEAGEAPREIVFGSVEFLELATRLADENRQGCIALQGDILLEIDGQPVLIKGPQQP